MLILKVMQDEFDVENNRLFRRKKRRVEKSSERSNIKVNDKIYTYVKMPYGVLREEETKRLLNRYKGRILFCESEALQEELSEYSFDYKPYFKRAVLSSLKNQIIASGSGSFSLCVRDESFVFNNEITELAKAIKKLTLITEESVATQEFTDYCFYNFGAVVFVTEDRAGNCDDMYIDLGSIDDSGKAFLNIRGKNMILYPDADYFIGNNGVRDLVSLGVPPKIACAGVELKKNIPVIWGNHNFS